MLLQRYYDALESYIEPGQVLVIYGPHRVGKTTLLQNYLADTRHTYKLGSGEDLRLQTILSYQNFEDILGYVSGIDLLVIDEAQDIPNIGKALKIIVDHRPDIRVVVTGSSSFDLHRQIGEPLVGRKRTLMMYPLSQLELQKQTTSFDLKQRLGSQLLFGSYPAVLTRDNTADRTRYLRELTDSYLLKDILGLDGVKNAKPVFDLLSLVAYQMGNEVSYHELGRQLGFDARTVERYLDLFEKAFIVTRLGGFSRNLRSELRRKHKYYFWDLGVRNAVIGNFNSLDGRADRGALWESFCVTERLKRNNYLEYHANSYFWRLYSGVEIDYVEDSGGRLHAYEFKMSPNKQVRTPASWQQGYPGSEFMTITPANYLDFVAT